MELSMLKLKILSILGLMLLSNGISAAPTAPIKDIHTQDIAQIISTGKPAVIIDARTVAYDDLNRIPGAKLLPYNATEGQIFQVIPQKNMTIIVYCTSTKCPASHYMAERLVRLGYKDVNKYQEGIVAWIAAGNPIEINQ